MIEFTPPQLVKLLEVEYASGRMERRGADL